MTSGRSGFDVEGPDRCEGRVGMIGTSGTRGGIDDVEGGISDGDNVGREAVALLLRTSRKMSGGREDRFGGGLKVSVAVSLGRALPSASGS